MNSTKLQKILLIGGDAEGLKIPAAILRKESLRFDLALSEKAWTKLLLHDHYGLIVIDLDSTVISGSELARTLRSSNRTKNTPLIFLASGLFDTSVFKHGYESGAMDFIPKPINDQQFLLKVYNFLKLHNTNVQLKKANRSLERKHVRAQISFQDLYNSLEQEIFLIDRKGIVSSINRTRRLICGLEPDEVQGKLFSKSSLLKKIFDNVTDFEKAYFKTELPPLGIKKQIDFEMSDGAMISIESSVNKILVEGAYYIQVALNDLSHKRKVENQLVMNFREISNSDKINQALIRGASLEEVSHLLMQSLGEIADTKASRIYMINELEKKLILIDEKLDAGIMSVVEKKIGMKMGKIIPPIDEGSFFRAVIDEKKAVITSDKSEIKRIISAHSGNAVLKKLSSWAQNFIGINTMGILPLQSNKTVFGMITFVSRKKLDSSEKIAIARYVKQAAMVLWRKKIELDLEENEERFNLAMKGANDGLWDWNIVTGKVYFSPRWKSMIGYKTDELENCVSTWENSLHPEDRERVFTRLNSYLENKTPDYEVEFRMKHKQGHYIDVLARGTGVKDKDGKYIRMVGTHLDLTARKREEEDKALLSSIIESTSDLVGIATEDHRIIYLNDAGRRMLGYRSDDILLKHISQIIPQKVYNNFVKKILNITQKKGRIEGETILLTKNIERVPVSFVILAHKNKLGEVRYYSTIARDITKVKEAQEKIRKSEAFNRSILSSISSQIAVIDSSGKIISVNESWNTFSKQNGENSLARTAVGGNYYEDCERAIAVKDLYASKALQGIKAVMNKEIPRFELEYPCSYKEEKRWFILSVTGFKDDYKKVVIRHTDITKRKENEEMLTKSQLEIRNFAGYLNKVLEDERSHIAREMHDEVGQQLSGIKMGLSLIVKEGALNSKLSQAANETSNLVDNAIRSMRSIATELRPGILDTLGLVPSLKWLCSEFEKKSGISCEIDSRAGQDIFEKDLSTCYFRICQESLNNIFKHAGATRVSLSIEKKDEMLSLKIADNGRGMSENSLKNPFSMGLLGMKERAFAIGGEVFINSKVNEGTTIEIITTLI